MGGRFKRKSTYVYLWLIHVDVWQKPSQYYKVITLQFKIKLKKKRITVVGGECEASGHPDTADGHIRGWCLMKQSI